MPQGYPFVFRACWLLYYWRPLLRVNLLFCRQNQIFQSLQPWAQPVSPNAIGKRIVHQKRRCIVWCELCLMMFDDSTVVWGGTVGCVESQVRVLIENGMAHSIPLVVIIFPTDIVIKWDQCPHFQKTPDASFNWIVWLLTGSKSAGYRAAEIVRADMGWCQGHFPAMARGLWHYVRLCLRRKITLSNDSIQY